MRPATFVILGASGDLASRLLLPAVGELLHRDTDRELTLIGAGSDAWDDDHWRDAVRKAFAAAGAEDEFPRVAETRYVQADITDPDALTSLLEPLHGPVVLYFAVPPAVAAAACTALQQVRLPEDLVLALEKPFGGDREGAAKLNAVLRDLVPERQVFRVDHFLGRDTVLNLLGVRFANRLVEPLWSAAHVEHVLIRFDESLALENRARYYDHAGAMVDMLQSHLLQILATLTMAPPATLGERDLRDAKGAALRATHIWDDDPVHFSRRARYTAGTIGDRRIPSYVDEPGVDPSRDTETLAEFTCEVRTSRWAGVPFTLRSGKALGTARAEVVVTFRKVRHLPEGFLGDAPDGGVLRFSLGPDTVTFELNVNGGDDPFELHREAATVALGEGRIHAYTQVLSEILEGDVTLSVRGDSAEECWRIVQPVQDAWSRGDVPLEDYPAGSPGPAGWATSQAS
ncbi:glucose-6-phosphate dehydrogenase [Microbacterium mangrovi]|uniref:Glucose-6-phosphate dehydrogenase n=1 Tax=Microbacterium mangrovi TaxID=1348253 RepID=A0A0B2ABK1_9MICO|nr:glucose-6-phosphate dehydrogenase [Microbacterium mangrovi]KHK99143.1 glucose-6-phosphate dehydrogenase [Microbacterium mangrovi]